MIKKFIYICLIAGLSVTSLFAKSGFEYGVFVPIGMSIGINYYTLTNTNSMTQEQFDESIKSESRKAAVGFDTGVLFNLGYRLELSKDFSISFLGEVGYAHDNFVFSTSYGKGSAKKGTTASYNFESLVFGFYPKFNIAKFSVGIAGGIKVPLYASAISTAYDFENNIIKKNIEGINALQMKNVFEVPIIPYVKLSLDYAVIQDKNFELVVGGYIGYDIGMPLKNATINNQSLVNITKQTISSFDIGIEIGTRILPK